MNPFASGLSFPRLGCFRLVPSLISSRSSAQMSGWRPTSFSCSASLGPLKSHGLTVPRGWPGRDAMGVGGRGIGYLVGCPKPIDRSDPMPEQFDSHNTTAAFEHDSTLVIA